MTTVRRFDVGEPLKKPERTPEGWLRVDGAMTRTGVLRYRNQDGSERLELRLPEEVFKKESLDSLRLRPVTIDHPPEFLGPKNTKDHLVGTVGETIRADGDLVVGPLFITVEDGIAELETGTRRQLSMGYSCRLEMTPGVWNGHRYDAIQREITYNHAALVELGRAGPRAHVRMDAADAVQITGEEPPPPPPRKEDAMTVKVKLGGVEYEMTEQAAQAVRVTTDGLQGELKASQDALASLKAESAKVQVKLDEAAEKLTKAEKERADALDPKRVRQLVDARVALETKAAALLGPKVKLDSMDEGEIQKAVILKAFPERKLDGKSADYVLACYEAALDVLGEEHQDEGEDDREDAEDGKEPALGRARKAARTDHTDDDDAKDPKSARAKMLKQNQDAWTKPMMATNAKA